MMEGINILVERIKTNPEEFVISSESNRWMSCIQDYWYLMLPEEQDGIREALRELSTSSFNERVLRTLMIQEKR